MKILIQETAGSLPLGGNWEYVCDVNAVILEQASRRVSLLLKLFTFGQGNNLM